jgi:hypothetical protein
MKLWESGFTVNNDLRSYSTYINPQFVSTIKKGELPGIMIHTCNPSTQELERKDSKFEASLGCIEAMAQKKKKNGEGELLSESQNFS